MSFKVIEDIKADEELFTHYGEQPRFKSGAFANLFRTFAGEQYFDTDNAACLCATCQKCVGRSILLVPNC